MTAYSPQVGDTVDCIGHGTCEVLLGPDAAGDYIVVDDIGEFWVQPPRAMSRVEPTPADQLVMIGADGDRYFESSDPLDDMRTWNAEPDQFGGCPWRVARFTFAEWIPADGSEGAAASYTEEPR